MITPSSTSAMAGFGFIYSLYMLLLIVEVWLVFRPTIVDRANSRRGAAGVFYRVMSLGICQMTAGGRAVDEWMIRALALTAHVGD